MDMNQNQNQNNPMYYAGGPQYPVPEKKKLHPVVYVLLSIAPLAASLALQFMIAIGVGIVAGIVAQVSYMGAHPEATPDILIGVYNDAVSKSASVSVFGYHILGIVVFGLWYYFATGKKKPTEAFRVLTPKAIVISVLAGLVMCTVANGMVGVMQYIMPKTLENYVEMMDKAGMGTEIPAIISAVLLAPIGEEFVCRGLALYYGKKAFGKFWIANILQALLFGIMHMNWIQGIYAFVIGLMLGYVRERFDSMIPSMILHFVLNATSTFLIGYVLQFVPEAWWTWTLVTLVFGAASVGLVFWGGLPKNNTIK